MYQIDILVCGLGYCLHPYSLDQPAEGRGAEIEHRLYAVDAQVVMEHLEPRQTGYLVRNRQLSSRRRAIDYDQLHIVLQRDN
jgi:hypothetical protein